MKKKICLALIGLPFFISVLSGCATLHIHTFTSQYEHDEHSHWKTCKICHERFEEHEHVFNQFNDTCFICDYHDPLVIVDQDNEMIGMTDYGKTKLTFDVPSNVTGIKKGAFDDAKAVTVKLNKELLYYDVDAFDDTSVKIITNEEGDTVQWVYDEDSGRMKKHSDYQAMVNGVYYETLKEAFESVGVGDTTITLLQDNPEIDGPIEVKHSITLVAYFSKMTLKCDFNIMPAGILYVPDTIECIGTFKLLLSEFSEMHAKGDASVDGNTLEDAYNTGAVAFANKNKCPDRVTVNYVTSFGAGAYPYKAVGAKQVANDLLVIPNNYFAFGTLRFTRDFKSVIGLTEFGKTVTKLTITNVVEGVDAVVGNRSFNIAWRFYFDIPGPDIYIRFCRPKGFFTDLIIGEGITSIGRSAFNNWIDGFFTSPLLEWADILFSHLFNVTIGPDVKEIGYHAFYDNVALTSVGVVRNKKEEHALTTIGEGAFAHAYNLVSADFGKANNLDTIRKNAFEGCGNLSQLALPDGRWRVSNMNYFPYDLTPARAGNLAHTNTGEWKKSAAITDKPISYTKSANKDSMGRFIDVEFTTTLEDALNNCAQGGEIYISEEYEQGDTIDVSGAGKMSKLQLTVNVAPGLPARLGRDFIVKRGGSGNITLNQDEYLVLNNAKPVGDVVLKAEGHYTQTGDVEQGNYIEHGTYMNPAGFATNLNSGFKVNLQNENSEGLPTRTLETVSNEVVIRDNAYQAYGLFGFGYDDHYLLGKKSLSNPQIDQLGSLSKTTSTITFGDQYKKEKDIVYYIDINKESGSAFSSLGSEITKMNFDGSVDVIGRNTFKDFKKLKEVNFGEKLTKILDSAFKNCSNLETADFSRVSGEEGFTFESNVFSGCTSLTRLDIPEGTRTLDPNVYEGCVSLSSVTLPSTLTSLPSFKDYSNLISVTLPSTLAEIPANSFQNCTYLSLIDIPETVTTIGASAFEGCASLTSLALPGALTTIGQQAFKDCISLESVTLPDDNSLASIGQNAFSCVDSEDPTLYAGSLISFHFGNNVHWKAGDTTLTEDLGDDWVAAKCLRQDYRNLAWTRI